MSSRTTLFLGDFDLKPMKRPLFSIIFLVLLCRIGLAQSLPARPDPPRLVNDFADVLSDEEELALEKKLVSFEDSTSTQVAVITIRSLEGYTVEEIAHKFLRDWGVGQKEKNNGVVILSAIEDRKVNIQTGLGMEGVLPDMICKRIITRHIVPAYKQKNYFEGLDKATDSIISISANEYSDDAGEGDADASVWVILLIMIGIFLFVSAMARRGQRNGTILSRRGYTGWDGGGWWYMPGNRGGGGDSGSGGGFDFGGFGGGDGGGGGASGSW